MARPESRFVCQSCAAAFVRWEGQCRTCGDWNTLVETLVQPTPRAGRSVQGHTSAAVPPPEPLAGPPGQPEIRRPIGLDEIDRVLGGGLVAGSLLLLGGEPGIGKSTLVLEIAAGVAGGIRGGAVVYASGEESAAQIRLRARRLGLTGGVAGERVSILVGTEVDGLIASAEAADPALLIVDSIQTLTAAGLEGPAGSVGQVREAALRLGRFARSSGVPVLLVGHVTKDGSLAGPKALEHLVDAVLTLDGERFGQVRLLRATKNRYGSTDEIGVLQMTSEGLHPVPDPGRAFLGETASEAPGVCVGATLEGSRPMLVEVQALVAPSGYGMPRRTVAGVDSNRLALLVAVLARRCGLDMSGHDLYVSLAGGASASEPALDLAVALSLASSFRNRPIRGQTVACGEVSLLGELRPVQGLDRRIREAARLGFRSMVAAPDSTRSSAPTGMDIDVVHTLRDALAVVLLPEMSTVGEGVSARDAVLGSPR